ncbi:hypothetical protein ATPR_0791 [Acetobacter tropicalis NBRC 101654]|uniref:Uncharacterized protein n=1 Tax=Acetobacter tropicalis NBRC 101654 TaxID=749388 RepID=F7VBP2_9PROT|nr:hypothetical protein ATPR_0791 [Acetobacter tropicalis NBRC 101654]
MILSPQGRYPIPWGSAFSTEAVVGSHYKMGHQMPRFHPQSSSAA